MEHHHGALTARDRQRLENLPVAQLQRIVGHVDLERCIAFSNQGRQFFTQHLRGGVGDDQVEGIIDHRLVTRPAMVVIDGRAQAFALLLAGERDDGGGAAAGRRDRAAEEVISHHRAVASRLVEVYMAVDATGGDMPACRVDFLETLRQVQAKGDDAPITNTDIAGERV
ncbi:hypothetical protein D3C76_735680 [compost metagenome]